MSKLTLDQLQAIATYIVINEIERDLSPDQILVELYFMNEFGFGLHGDGTSRMTWEAHCKVSPAPSYQPSESILVMKDEAEYLGQRFIDYFLSSSIECPGFYGSLAHKWVTKSLVRLTKILISP